MVFYGFVFTGMVFLAVSQCFGIRKCYKEDGISVKGSSGDFISKYYDTNREFCKKSFELLVTLVIIWFEYTTKRFKFIQKSSYLPEIIILSLNGFVTACSTHKFFGRDKGKDYEIRIHILRFILILSSFVKMLCTDG